MLFDLEPAKEVSGGPWYTDQEFDHEYLELLSRELIRIVRAQGIADVNTIAEKIRLSGVSKVTLVVVCFIFLRLIVKNCVRWSWLAMSLSW